MSDGPLEDSVNERELRKLVDAWCNRTITEEQVARLEELLSDSRNARSYYRRMMNIHAELHAQCEIGVNEGALPQLAQGGVNRLFAWAGWAVAGLLAIGALIYHFGPTQQKTPISTIPESPQEVEMVGVMVNQSGAKFAGEEGMPLSFETKNYRLEGGIIHLRLTNGVDVVVRGPATFGIHNPMLLTLEQGALRAIVPNSGKGFTVQAPQMLYEDLGTEFGVFVEEGRSEMHVFNGQVDVHRISTKSKVASVFNGESLKQNGDKFTVDLAKSEVEFPLPEDVGYRGWMSQKPSVIAPEGLIGYYPFSFDLAKPNVLENQIKNTSGKQVMADGRILGARWVSGRWSEKDALLFNQAGERVEFELLGEFEEITCSVWANIDHLDNSLNSILNSTGWEEGDLHWQILRSQDPILAVHEIKESGSLLVQPIEPGRWIHLVAVVSKNERRTRFYVDGHLAQENQLPPGILLSPGEIWLGDWQPNAQALYLKRNFRGKIDELAIWNRALSEEEIKELTVVGAPSMLVLGQEPAKIPSPRPAALFPAYDRTPQN